VTECSRIETKRRGFAFVIERTNGPVMTKRANQYRDLAHDCQRIANSLPAGSDSRAALLEMAQIWKRLADEQERATDLRKKE
jgi:hypothetical protein